MEQYHPEVTEADIERIVRREYPPELHASIHEKIRVVEVSGKSRVVMACLKNAHGDIKRLESQLAEASGYYREILAEAEYPNYMKVHFRIERLPAEEQERIFEKDKAQYLRWLHADRET